MSSILKALKKLETSGYPKNAGGPYPYRLETEPTPRRQMSFSWMLNLAIFLLCMAIVLLVFTRIPLFEKPKKARDIMPRSETPAFDMELINPLKKKALEFEGASESRDRKEEKPDRPLNTTPLVSAEGAHESLKQESSPNQAQKAASRETQASKKASLPKPRKRASIRFLDRSEFRLEGVVTVDSTSTRYAIINDSIVREGGWVKGYKVIDIQRNYVDVQGPDGSSKFRIEAP